MNTFNNKNIFLTTTLPYVNSNPHIGHAFEFILGDAISRHLKINNNVQFNIGLDEHGLKVYTKAKELGISTYDYIEELTSIWLEFCQKFNIEYDSFYKTSSDLHHIKVKKIWSKFLEKGDIYKKSYSGKYCVGCESFKLDKELVKGRCTDHPTTKLQIIEEENYFFKLSKYRDSLLKWIETNPEFLEPQYKLEELKNLILGSDDISISRLKSNCPWGVEVPNDPDQVIYVWFDALLNYIFAAGYLSDEFNWDNVIQICGPDNLRFQAVIFQSFLEAEGIKKSDKLLVHGTILDENGRKMSKTLGNTIDPIDQLNKYGLDAVRYYALCGLSTYYNSNWNEKDLVNLYNSDICNDWGNLISRVLHLIDTKCNGFSDDDSISSDENFTKIIDKYTNDINILWDSFKVKEALQKTNELVKFGNRYINEEKPWNNGNYKQILINLYFLLIQINNLYSPVFPDSCDDVTEAIIIHRKKIILFNRISEIKNP